MNDDYDDNNNDGYDGNDDILIMWLYDESEWSQLQETIFLL